MRDITQLAAASASRNRLRCKEPPRPRPFHTAVAGLAGGAAVALVSNPLRVVLTRMQLGRGPTDFFSGLHQLGLRGSMQGSGLSCASSALGQMGCFTVQQALQNRLGGAQASFAANIFGAVVGGATSAIAINPAMRALVERAVPGWQAQSFHRQVQGWVRTEGLTGPFRGALTGAVRNAAAWGAWFAVMHTMRKRDNAETPAGRLQTGALASVAACLSSMPIECVATNMQADTATNVRGAVLNIYRRGGFGGFYAGAGSRLAGAVPLMMLNTLIVGETLRLLQHIDNSAEIPCNPASARATKDA